MPDERVPQTNTTPDPLSDEGLGLSKPDEQSGTTDGVQSSPDSQGDGQDGAQTPDFGGLPFKSMDEMVKGHKNLQTAYRDTRTKLYQMEQYLQSIAPQLEALRQPKGGAPEPVDIPKFLEEFIQQGPAAISRIAGKDIDNRLQTQLGPVMAQIQKLQNDREIDRYMGEHPEINSEDEDALLEIIYATPWIQRLNGTVSEKLDAALGALLRKDPTHFSSRATQAKTDNSRDLNAMKQSAGMVGTKAGTRQKAAKDEFDEVLEQDTASRARWR